MARDSKITYYENLTIAENAEKNHVSISGMNYYIKTHNIDRRYENSARLISECRKYFRKHPKATKGEIAKETGYSRFAVNKHWEYITTDATYSKLNPNKVKIHAEENAESVKTQTNRKELLSEALADIPEMFRKADEADVSEFRKFIIEEPQKPMLFIGSGGMGGSFPALLYGMDKGIGQAITPYSFASVSDDAVRNSRCMLMSASGNNDDIAYAARRCVKLNPQNTACYTYDTGKDDDGRNNLLSLLNGTGARVFKYPHPYYLPRPKRGFISSRTKFYKYAILYRAFTGKTISNRIEVDLAPEKCFTYRLNKEGTNLPNLRKINHFCVLYGGFGQPVAGDIESMFAETGMASVQMSDYRNFCHGRFIFVGNHTKNPKEPRIESDAAVIMLITPREKEIAKRLLDNVIPYQTPIVFIESELNSPLATIDLMVKSNVFISYVGEKCYGINPNSPENYSSIDKEFPIQGVKFLEELNRGGNLTYDEPDNSVIDGWKRQIDDYIAQEHTNTEQIESEKSYLPYPTKKDLFKKEKEQYDASKYLCYAFRRKGDLHKTEQMPLGNMNGGFPFKINGIKFHTSESAYICGLFSDNTEKHQMIQKLLVEETNGYAAKKKIRGAYKGEGRKDWESFNIEWMLYVVWQKVQGNKEFRDILMGIPEGATIIENSTFHKKSVPDTAAFWGCRNQSMKDFHTIVGKYVSAMNPESDTEEDRMVAAYMNDFCNHGIFEGNNEMGKVLMIVKKCLHDGTEPQIDYELLKSKNIYLMGQSVFSEEQPKPNKISTEVEAKQKDSDKDIESPTKKKSSVVVSDNGHLYKNALIGACAGDVIGSRYEHRKNRVYTTDFELFPTRCGYTDDTIHTIATMEFLLGGEQTDRRLCDLYYDYSVANKFRGRICVYGGDFKRWLKEGTKELYRASDGNGAAMRVSPIAWAFDSEEDVLRVAEQSARTTHNGAEAIKGAKAIALATFLARQKATKDEIRIRLIDECGYNLYKTCEEWRNDYKWRSEHYNPMDIGCKVSLCQNSVPAAIRAFLEGEDFESTIRLSVSLGGDADTLAAMAGGIAEAYYEIPDAIRAQMDKRLKPEFISVINSFTAKFRK